MFQFVKKLSKYKKIYKSYNNKNNKLYRNSRKFWNLHKNSEKLYEMFWKCSEKNFFQGVH